MATTSAPKSDPAAALRVLAKDLEQLKEHAEQADAVTGEIRTLATEAKDSSDSAQRAVVSLGETVSSIADHLQAMEDALLRSGDDEPPEPRFHWLLVDNPEEAKQELADLVVWIGTVYLRFHGTELPACWIWHETVVAELHVLYSGWQEARDGRTGSAFKLMDWHDRYRPSAAERIKGELSDCSTGREFQAHLGAAGFLVHRPPSVPGLDLGGVLAEWWARTHGQDPAPQPTDEMVAEAKKESREKGEKFKNRHRIEHPS